jgi:hypothetical protein
MRNLSFLLPERHELTVCLLPVLIGFLSEGTQLHANKQNCKKGDDGKYSPQASHGTGGQFSLWIFLYTLGVFVSNRKEANLISENNLLNYTYSDFFNC